MADVVIGEFTWDAIWPACEPLMEQHHKEVREKELQPFKVDVETAYKLDACGALVIAGAISGHSLVGYSIWYLSPNLESAGNIIASQGPWFVLPAFRGETGKDLWQFSMFQLKKRGVKVIHAHHWMHGDGPRLGKFFKKLGGTPLETVYEIWIGD